MKKNTILTLIILVAGLFCFFGCKKDTSEEEKNKTAYKLVESISSNDSLDLYRTVYTYNGDKIILIENYSSSVKDTSWENTSKTEITYPDNTTLNKANYNYHNGSWEENTNEIITHQDGRWQEYTKYNSNGTEQLKTNYTYNDNKIIKKETVIYTQGEMVPYRTHFFTWIGDFPATAEYYFFNDDSSTYILKDTITLSNGKVIKIETNAYFEKEDFNLKREFQYVGENVSSIILYTNISGSWIEGESELFYYDENGNMITRELGLLKTNFSYEENGGNLSFVEGYSTDFYYLFYPLPIKSGNNFQENIPDIIFNDI